MLPSARNRFTPDSNRLLYVAAGLATLSMIVFPAADAVAKTLSGTVPVVVIVWARFFGSALLITPLYLLHRPLPRPTMRAATTELLRACIVIAAFGSFVISFQTISFAEAMTYYSFAPIVAAGLSVLVLKEKMNLIKILALCVGLAGVGVALNPTISPAPGAYFALLTGALYGSYLMLNRVVAIRWNPTLALFLQFWIGSFLLLPVVWPELSIDLLPHVPRLAAMAVISIACNIMLINAFRFAEGSFLAPFMYVEVPAALLMAVIFFGETPSWNLLIGAGMILFAGLLVIRRAKSYHLEAGSTKTETVENRLRGK